MTLLERLKDYRDSMTEFSEEEMDYLIKLVERDQETEIQYFSIPEGSAPSVRFKMPLQAPRKPVQRFL